MRMATVLGAGAVLALVVGVPSPASAAGAGPVSRTADCVNEAMDFTATFTTARVGEFGKLRYVHVFTHLGATDDDPVMTVRVRDGQGVVRAFRRSADGSKTVYPAVLIGGPDWTAEAAIENVFQAPRCVTPRVRIAVR